jgi:hypothetical protein
MIVKEIEPVKSPPPLTVVGIFINKTAGSSNRSRSEIVLEQRSCSDLGRKITCVSSVHVLGCPPLFACFFPFVFLSLVLGLVF